MNPVSYTHLTDREVMDISCRPERTGTGTVRHHHGADENCRGRNRGIEAYPPNGKMCIRDRNRSIYNRNYWIYSCLWVCADSEEKVKTIQFNN